MIFGDRDLNDQKDLFRCLSAKSGKVIWAVSYDAPGELDYGNTPRATPLIDKNRVYLFGAFGDLHCVDLATGLVHWKKNLLLEFATKEKPTWGTCSSPLIVDNKLIVNPGAKEAALVALDLATGKVKWQTFGNAAAYGSLIAGRFGGVLQIVGHDAKSIGGWDVKTGKRLWTIKPKFEGDFNVPTPLAVDGKLLITTENNGTRLFAFEKNGKINPKPIAVNEYLAPDMSSPILINSRVFCIYSDLYCLDVKNKLKPLYTASDEALSEYAAMITDGKRILVIAKGGRLLLLDARAKKFTVISRLNAFKNPNMNEIYSHPALVNGRLYLRGDSSLVCIDLSAQ